jgi:hypothetical protein
MKIVLCFVLAATALAGAALAEEAAAQAAASGPAAEPKALVELATRLHEVALQARDSGTTFQRGNQPYIDERFVARVRELEFQAAKHVDAVKAAGDDPARSRPAFEATLDAYCLALDDYAEIRVHRQRLAQPLSPAYASFDRVREAMGELLPRYDIASCEAHREAKKDAGGPAPAGTDEAKP